MKETTSVNSLNKIIENLDIVKVVSEYLTLKKAGRNFQALCPFHEEKTPSFVVSPEKQIFHCFGCGVGGDAIKFLMSIENIPFPEALALASEKTGIPITLSRYASQNTEKIKKLYQVNEFAAKIFTSLLFSNMGKTALEYLLARNLKESDIKTFNIGYAPNLRDFLVKKIKAEKLNMQDFIKAGLIKEDGKTDVFRNRIIFPIFDFKGKVTGFGGRALDEKQIPKYLNTSENDVFSKGKILYGMNWAANNIKEKGFAIIVEGYLDVIKLYINGVTNVIAPMGTSLTGTQANLLKRFTENILLLFDSDQAGMRATLRNLEIVLNKGFEAKFCLLPVGFDPDKFVDDYGVKPLIDLINKSRNFLDFSFDIYSQQYGTTTPKGKSSIAREIMKYIEVIPDEIEKSEYRKMLAEKLNIQENTLSQYISTKEEVKKEDTQKEMSCKSSPKNLTEDLLMEIMLSDKEYWKEFLKWDGRMTSRINIIAQASKKLLSNNIQLTPSNLISWMNDIESSENINHWITKCALKDISHINKERKHVIFYDCLNKIHKICLIEQVDNIKKEMSVKKDNGLQYKEELETLQSLLFELKREE